MDFSEYKTALIAALLFHLSLLLLLSFERSHARPVLMPATQTDASAQVSTPPMVEPMKAVSVNNQEVREAVERLKQEKVREQNQEKNRQRALEQEAQRVRQQRLAEQQRLQALKEEAAKLALAHKQALAEEQRHLAALAQQKAQEEAQLVKLKQQAVIEKQKQEAAKKRLEEQKKLVEKKLVEQKIAAQKALDQKQALEKQHAAELAQKQKAEAAAVAAAQQAALNAKNARIAGEVDKYKALIINAIGRQWILPEQVNQSLSSQFRIRLAPNGSVLEVSLMRSSGDPILDRSAQAAIYKASPLPVPSDTETFNLFRDISLTVRPESARG